MVLHLAACRHRLLGLPAVLVATVLVAGCGGKPEASGGYYGGDAPPDTVSVDLDAIPDAVPRSEPLSASGNQPYTALGKTYRPLNSAHGYVQRGTASWYGKKFHGRRTSSGEQYDMFAMTAAHPLLPLPTYVQVTNLDNGKSVVVKVNDRGPFLQGRLIDLSYAAAHRIDILARGSGQVEVRAIDTAPETAADTSTTPPVSVATTESASPESTTVLLQVGAYAQRVNAAAMRHRLLQAGYTVTPLIATTTTSGPPLYRVQVGPFRNHIAAQATQARLQALLQQPVLWLAQ